MTVWKRFRVILIPGFLVAILILLHAPALNFGFQLRGLDRIHDFWGGLLVEMVGVTIELGLILFVLTELEDRRWKPVRQNVSYQVTEALLDEFGWFNRFHPDPNSNTNLILEEYDSAHARSLIRMNRLTDFLQYANNAFTPEMASEISIFMDDYQAFLRQYELSDAILGDALREDMADGLQNLLRSRAEIQIQILGTMVETLQSFVPANLLEMLNGRLVRARRHVSITYHILGP